MAAFAQFASDLDAATQRLLSRGERLTELLKQPQYSPLPVEEQVVAIFAGVNGYLDSLDTRDITQFELGLMSELRGNHSLTLQTIREEQAVSEETETKLKEVLQGYLKKFTPD